MGASLLAKVDQPMNLRRLYHSLREQALSHKCYAGHLLATSISIDL